MKPVMCRFGGRLTLWLRVFSGMLRLAIVPWCMTFLRSSFHVSYSLGSYFPKLHRNRGHWFSLDLYWTILLVLSSNRENLNTLFMYKCKHWLPAFKWFCRRECSTFCICINVSNKIEKGAFLDTGKAIATLQICWLGDLYCADWSLLCFLPPLKEENQYRRPSCYQELLTEHSDYDQ